MRYLLSTPTSRAGNRPCPLVLFAAGFWGTPGPLRWPHRRVPDRPGAARRGVGVLPAGQRLASPTAGKVPAQPIVLAAYAYNRSLSERGRGDLFAFLMAFFGGPHPAAAAWPGCGSPGHPIYRDTDPPPGCHAGAAAAAGALFCARPCWFRCPCSTCPGTWLPVLYASLMACWCWPSVACNVSSSAQTNAWPPAAPPRGPPRRRPRIQGWSRTEVHPQGQPPLLQMMISHSGSISHPPIRVYMGAFAADFNENADLSALRFLSVNSIVDPWVFIIFRTSVFRTFVRRVEHRAWDAQSLGESVQGSDHFNGRSISPQPHVLTGFNICLK
uniref:Prostaglandin D2 receptor n=1 Tax=Malurus cyaneus samueli TaxID=2593467 RepID=A0A8C5T8X6_9PASS